MVRVGVFFGGLSIEREASYNSGRTVCDHIDIARYHVIPIFQTSHGTLYILPQRFLHRGKISDFEHRLEGEATRVSWDSLPSLIDFAFLALHGRYAEDGAIQGMLSLLGIPYLGSKIYASAISRDKTWLKKIVTLNSIATPPGITLPHSYIKPLSHLSPTERIYALTQKIAHLNYPLVIKPIHEGSSLGVSVAHTVDDLYTALEHAATISTPLYQDVLIEEKVAGMEFTCIIITDPHTGELRALPPTEVVPEQRSAFFDYEQKYMPGRGHKYTPARCSTEQIRNIQETCLRAARAIEITNFVRIDGFLQNDNVTIIDVNTLGGMAPASFMFLQAAEIGMSHTQLINHLIDTELSIASSTATQHVPSDQQHASKRTLRVAVLMGGASAERETSLDSGRNITYKLSPHTYTTIPLFVTEQHALYRMSQKDIVKNSTAEIALGLTDEKRVAWHMLPEIADFVFIGLHGGLGENGGVQGALELLKLPYNGSSIATSALCMDKYKTNQLLEAEGFAIPRHLLITTAQHDSTYLEEVLSRAGLTFPLISKPHDDGCSVLVRKNSSIDDLRKSITEMHHAGRSLILIEELIHGMELTVGVLGNTEPTALPATYTVATAGVLSLEEKFLPGAGENQTPAPLGQTAMQHVQRVIEQVYRTVQCRGYARIDCFYQNAEQSPTGAARVVIIEINTLPALTPATCLFHQAAEVAIKPMELLDSIIALGIEAHQASTRTDVLADTAYYRTLQEKRSTTCP